VRAAVLTHDRAARGPWARAIAFGALGGLTLTAIELLLLPFDLASPELWRIVARVAPQWIAFGIGAACVVSGVARRRVGAAALALALVAYGAGATAAFAGARSVLLRVAIPSAGDLLGLEFPELAAILYDAWLIALFGGLFALACAIGARGERVRVALAQRALEHARMETLLGEAQIATLRARVDPALLLRVIEAADARYASDAAAADRLVDLLVRFLRDAMPGVRTGASTLAGEVAIARAYAALCRELDDSVRQPRIEAPESLPDIAFPPLVLLPLLGQVHAGPAAASAVLRVRPAADRVVIDVEPSGDASIAWSEDALYRVRVALGATLPGAWSLASTPDSSHDRARLRLTLPIAASRTAAPAVLSPGAAHA
jgi:hypothetical protein